MRYPVFLLAAFLAVPALAQVTAPDPPITLPSSLVNRIYSYLMTGGTFSEAAALHAAIEDAVRAVDREKDVQRRIDAAVAAAIAKKDPPSSPASK